MRITSIKHFVLLASTCCATLTLTCTAASDDILVIGATSPSGKRPAADSAEPGAPNDATPGTVQIIESPKSEPVLTDGKSPIGSVTAWMRSMPKTPALPNGWIECNGQEIKDPGSPYQGQFAPNLNGAGGEPSRFLRGAAASGATGGSEYHTHDDVRAQKYGDARKPVSGIMRGNHLPPYYDVIWIMRIK